MSGVYTSTTATKSIADRLVREVHRHAMAPFDALASFIKPTAQLLRARGKLSRTELPTLFTAIRQRLLDTDTIIDLDQGRVSTGRMSANDSYTLRFVQAVGGSEEWMVFMACDVQVSRQQIVIFVNSTEFHVSTHLLARYMQRGRKSYINFLATVMRPLRMSALLSAGQVATPSDRIALPIDGGILVGTVDVESSEDNAYPLRFTFDRNGCKHEIDRAHGIFSGRIVSTWMRSFIDRDSLNPKKHALLDSLEQWERNNQQGIDALYQALVFGCTRLRNGHTVEHIKTVVSKAVDECRGLVTSPEWQDL